MTLTWLPNGWPMSPAEAKQVILKHAVCLPEGSTLSWEDGFLGSLRPYRGLNVANFHELMTALIAFAPELINKALLDAEVITALWGTCQSARDWGVHPDGMLRRNGLISADDVASLDTWVECLANAALAMLHSSNYESAFEMIVADLDAFAGDDGAPLLDLLLGKT